MADIEFGFRENYGESYDQETTEVRAEVQTSWADVAAFPAFVLGDVTGELQTIMDRKLPLQHPTKRWLWASSLSLRRCVGAFRKNKTTKLIEFYDNDNSKPDTKDAPPGKAQWDLTYSPRNYIVLKNADVVSELQRFVIKESDFNLEALQVPGDVFKFQTTGTPIPEGMAIQNQLVLWTYTWVIVPDIRAQGIRIGILPAMMGRVNSVEFDGMAAGTALCLAPKYSPLKYTAAGTPIRDIQFHFVQRVNSTWNQAYNRGKVPPGFDNVIARAAGGNPPYLSADFNRIFATP